MKKTANYGLLIALLLTVTAISGSAQLQKRVDFSISAPFALRMGDYLLPAGNYVLRQVSQNDLNLFSLHPQDLTNEPIAIIRTARVDYSGKYPEDTKLYVEMEESSPDNHPVVQGWTIPGMDGWEVIGVVEKKSGVLAKVDSRLAKSGKYKLDRSKMSFDRYGEKDRRSKIEFKRIEK